MANVSSAARLLSVCRTDKAKTIIINAPWDNRFFNSII